jgi:hypothetical protein
VKAVVETNKDDTYDVIDDLHVSVTLRHFRPICVKEDWDMCEFRCREFETCVKVEVKRI